MYFKVYIWSTSGSQVAAIALEGELTRELCNTRPDPSHVLQNSSPRAWMSSGSYTRSTFRLRSIDSLGVLQLLLNSREPG